MSWRVPLFDLVLGDEEIEAVTRVLKSGWLTMGEETQTFEREFAEYLGVKYALATSSCTAALHLAHLALGAGPGDEVICPSLTFVATPNSILYTGGKPVFADVTGLDNFNISPIDIERKITNKTKGITIVHYAGYPCDMDAITAIAKKYNLYLVEDCAHAPGAEYKGQKLGTFGDIACFSFFSNKNLSTGEGGMVVTNRDDLFEKLKLMRSHGMTSLTLDRHKGHAFSYDVISLGFNYRIDEIRAALGRVQLRKLETNNERRKELVGYYNQGLKDCPYISIPFLDHTEKSAYHIFPILLNEGINRAALMNYLRERGIQTSIHYHPVHQFTYYQQMVSRDLHLPYTETLGKRVLTLPLYPTMNKSDVDYVVKNLKEWLFKNAKKC